jgi:hypothetical protein
MIAVGWELAFFVVRYPIAEQVAALCAGVLPAVAAAFFGIRNQAVIRRGKTTPLEG